MLKYEDIVAKVFSVTDNTWAWMSLHFAMTFGQQRVINPKDLKQDNAYEPVTEKKENKDTTEPPAGALQPPVKWR